MSTWTDRGLAYTVSFHGKPVEIYQGTKELDFLRAVPEARPFESAQPSSVAGLQTCQIYFSFGPVLISETRTTTARLPSQAGMTSCTGAEKDWIAVRAPKIMKRM